jgi:hypothetical protein
MEILYFYDYETVAALGALDLGTVPLGSSADTLMRVFNGSELYQAEDVTVTVTGAEAIQLWLSSDGDSFTAQLALGDIPPGALSSTFWLRRVTASTDNAGSCSATLRAVPTAWTNPMDTSSSTNIALDTEDN